MRTENPNEEATAGPGAGVEPGTLSRLIRDIAADGDARGEDGPAPLGEGAVVGRFRLLRELGRGGFGVVHEAEDTVLPRRVALKLVRTGPRSSLRSERLLEEAEAAARLAHPNIVTLHDVGRSEHGPYLVLELLDGEVLQRRLSRGALPPAEAVRIAAGVARGLAHAHARGVVHRDLKPGNVFLTRDGHVKVLDFGLAHAFGLKRVEGGTPAYMAPEQRAGGDEDERTDVYALGVLLFRMLAGRLPFAPEDPEAAAPGAGRAPALELPGLPALGELVALMLERDPAARPRDGGEVLRALEPILALLTAAAPAPEAIAVRPAPRAPPWWRTRRAQALGLALLVAIAAGGAAAARLLRPPPPAPRPVVAVADVENLTGDPELDGLGALLSTSLEQSRRLEVLTTERLRELSAQAGHPAGARIDEARGLELCRRAAADALVVTAVRRLGTSYTVEAKLAEPGRAAHRATFREQVATKEALLPSLDRLAERLREALAGRERGGGGPGVEALVTGNLEAYRHYLRGREEYRKVEYAEAARAYQAALAVDPDFALAHLELARIGRLGELPRDLAAGHLSDALRLAARLPEKERHLLEAWRLADAGDADGADRTFEALAEDFPNEADVALELGQRLAARDQVEAAVPHLKRASALRPADIIAGWELARALGWLGRADEAVEQARRQHAATPSPGSAVVLGTALEVAGRYAEAVPLGRAALGGGEPQGRSLVMSASHASEDFATVEREVSENLRAPLATDRARAQGNLAATLVWQGRRAEALRAIASAEDGDFPGFMTRFRVMLLAGLGEPGRLRAEAQRLAEVDPENAILAAPAVAWAGDPGSAALLARRLPPSGANGRLHAAVVGWRAGDARALEELHRLAATHASGELLDGFFFGEAALEAGRPEEARAALERFLRLPVKTGWSAWAKPRARLRLAQALERLGRLDEARAVAERVAVTWRRADADYPPAAELRALRDRLGR
ncbi:MAG: protein kinase [Anaeromyxobacteraceae bacterium]